MCSVAWPHLPTYQYAVLTNSRFSLPFGWTIPIAVLFVISFPPVRLNLGRPSPAAVINKTLVSALRPRDRCHSVWARLGSLAWLCYCSCRYFPRRAGQLLVRSVSRSTPSSSADRATFANQPAIIIALSNGAVLHAARNWREPS